MRKNKFGGQEATEFVLISILVFFSALMVVFIFGGKLANFFGAQSSAVKASQGSSNAINSSSSQKYNNTVDSYNGPTTSPSQTTGGTAGAMAGSTQNIAGYQVTENSDGSLSFSVQGQTVNIPADVKQLAETVSKTTGSSAYKDLVEAIAYMINTHKADYPASSVPIQLKFGEGTHLSPYGSLYTGQSSENIISVMGPDNHAVLLQNDHECSGGGCNYQGNYRIEWKNNSVTGFKGIGGEAKDLNFSNLNSWSNNNNVYTGKCSIEGTEHTWSLDFSDDSKKYSI